MTDAEFRDLIRLVEKHGGPVRVEPNIVGDYIVLYRAGLNYEGDRYAEEWCRLDVAQNDRHADRIVGVLKRDLIERGYVVDVRIGAMATTVDVDRRLTPVASETGDFELEAILKAWLAAAEAEGWTA